MGKQSDYYDALLEEPLDERAPEIESLLTGDRSTKGRQIEGSGVTDTKDPIVLAKRDNADAF